MIQRKPKRGNMRKKVSEEEGGAGGGDSSTSASSTSSSVPVVSSVGGGEREKKRKAKKRTSEKKGGSSGGAMLSFEDGEDGGEAFQLKKSKRSQQIAKGKSKNPSERGGIKMRRAPSEGRGGVVSVEEQLRGGVSYSKEALEALKKNSISFSTSTKTEDKMDVDQEGEGEKKEGEKKEGGKGMGEEVIMSIDLTEFDEEQQRSYPTHNQIDRAKRKRETRRLLSGATDDFIPLDGGRGGRGAGVVSTGKGGVFGTLAQPYGYSGDHEGSALAREQEDSDEEDHYGGQKHTISFGDPGKESRNPRPPSSSSSSLSHSLPPQRDRGRRGEKNDFRSSVLSSVVAQHHGEGREGTGRRRGGRGGDSEEEEEEEVMEWELEQMKKGGLSSGRAGRGGRVRGDNSDPALGFDRKRGRERERERERERVGGRVGDEFEMLEEVPAGPEKNKYDEVTRIVEQCMNRLKEKKENRRQNLEQVSERLKDISQTIDNLENDLEDVNRRYVYFQEVSVYVNNLLSCLSAKVGEIEELEEEKKKIIAERYRGQQQARDESFEDMRKRLEHLLNGESMDDEGGEEEVDEFGRDKGEMKRRAREERLANLAAVSQKRKKIREEKGMGYEDFEEGWSSDEENETDVKRCTEGVRSLCNEGEEIFEDTFEDFSSLTRVLANFSIWRSRYIDAYKQAYCSLCLPRILTPYIVIDCMPWHPLSTRDARETSKVDDMSGSLDGWIGAGGGGLGGGRAGLGGKKVGDELGRGLGLGFGRGGGGGGGERKEEDLLFRSMEGMEWVGEVVEFAAGGEEGGEGENDKELVGKLFEGAFLPLLQFEIERVFDPLSSCHSSALAKVCEEMAVHFPADGVKKKSEGVINTQQKGPFSEILHQILDMFSAFLEVIPVVFPKILGRTQRDKEINKQRERQRDRWRMVRRGEAEGEEDRFVKKSLERCLWMCLKVLRNVSLFYRFANLRFRILDFFETTLEEKILPFLKACLDLSLPCCPHPENILKICKNFLESFPKEAITNSKGVPFQLKELSTFLLRLSSSPPSSSSPFNKKELSICLQMMNCSV